MNDTLSIKGLLKQTLDSANFGVASAFARVASSDIGQKLRRSLMFGSLSPVTLRISHQPITAKRSVQRSLASMDSILTRLDVNDVAIGEDFCNVALQFSRSKGITESEFVDRLTLLAGALLENDAQLAKELYNTEE